MNRAVLGVDARPAALGLDRAVRCLKAGPVGAGADAMRDLIEAVAQGLRADLDRLEQNVVFRIARHTIFLKGAVLVMWRYCSEGLVIIMSVTVGQIFCVPGN